MDVHREGTDREKVRPKSTAENTAGSTSGNTERCTPGNSAGNTSGQTDEIETERTDREALKNRETSARKRRMSPAVSFFLKLAVIAAVLILLDRFVFGMARISGNSMYPSLRDGDLCFFFRLEDYHTGDIVRYKDTDGESHIGRIVVMDGQFDIRDNRPLLNGSVLSEEVVYSTPPGQYPLPADVGEREYWIMNDFRSDTEDSRNFGPIPRENLDGKVMFLFRRRGF